MADPSSKDLKRNLYRSRHRMRSHDEAHAEGALRPPPPPLDHPMVPKDQSPLIDNDADLLGLVESLRSAGSFAYDTEFIGEHSYHPQLCVIQVATRERVTLVDAMADLNLKPFWELLAESAVKKIVHAGLHDLEPVVRHLHRGPANIVDTQIAAGFIGLRFPMGTSKLIAELTGADLGGGAKFSQWDHRPLSPIQLQYAANDVRYLPLLEHVIVERLTSNGNFAWAMEECQTLSDPALYRFDAQSQRLRVRGSEHLDRARRTVLRALLIWREDAARQEDVPPRSLLRDDVVLALASAPATSIADLDLVRGLPRPIEERYGQHIVDLTKRALEAPQADVEPGYRRRADRHAYKKRIDAMWHAIQARCAQKSIDPSLAASRKEVGEIVQARAEGKPPPPGRLLRGWRRELLIGLGVE